MDLRPLPVMDAKLEPKWYKDPMQLVSNPEIQLIVELIGGSSGMAFEISKKALTKKKHLVTANKAMLALHGNKLSNMADKNGVTINFEGAVAGGIPIINLIQNSLLPDKISSVYGILNGTCNYILTQMFEKKRDSMVFLVRKPQAQRNFPLGTPPCFENRARSNISSRRS